MSLILAFIIIGEIVVATIVLVLVFKYGYVWLLHGFLVLTVTAVLGWMGYSLLIALVTTYNSPLDYITMVLLFV